MSDAPQDRDEIDEIDVLVESRAQPRSVRDLPALIASSFRMLREAAPGRVNVLVALQVVGALLAALLVYLGKRSLDVLLRPDRAASSSSLWRALPLLLAVVAIAALTEAIAAVVAAQLRLLGEILQRATWADVLETSERLDLEDFEDPAFFDQLQRVRANALLRPFQLVTGLLGLAGGVAGALALAATLFALQPLLLPVLLLGGLPLWLASRRTGRLEFEFEVAQTPTLRAREYLARVLTSRDSAKEVRSYALGPAFRQRWGAHYATYIDQLRAHVRRRTRLALIGTLATALAVAATTAMLVWLVSTGRARLGDAGAAAIAIRLFASRLQQTATGASQLVECKLFLRDLHDFLGRAPQSRSSAAGAAPAEIFAGISTESVRFRYPGSDHDVLTDVSMTIRPGEIVALVGANGSGKTTLAKLLAQLYAPTGGRIMWGSMPADSLERAAIRRQLAVVFQDFARYQLSARDNIGVGDATRMDDDASTRAAAKHAGADAIIEALPLGYDTILSREFKGGRDLSLGEWQRIALARAFHRDAQLLILDEPTASLDARAEHDLFERIRTLFAGRSVLLIAHRFSSVRSADRIYVLDAGRVIEHGTHEQLMSTGGVYAELFTLQAAAYQDGS